MTHAPKRHFARALLRPSEPAAHPALGETRTRFGWEVALEPRRQYCWFIDRLVERIEQLGLGISIEHDFAAFAAATPLMEDYRGGVNPAFDPRCNDMSPERSFWLKVVDGEDRLVSCIAGKLFRVTSLYPMIESLAVWYDNDPSVPHADEPVEMLSETPRAIAGTVSMTGRLWTHPRWRNRGLSSYLPLLARSMFLARYAVDFHFGFVALPLVRKNLPVLRYGFPRVERCFRVLQRGLAEPIELHLVWMSRAELVADVEDAVSD
jgi:GNAT superfamily N-acetyltransferase